MLTLAARQLGYWHAVPEGGKKTRGQEAIADGIEPDMPDLTGLDRLWSAWNEAGRCAAGLPLPWAEVEAYARINDLTRNDAVTLRRMSEAYLEGLAMVSPLSIMPMELDGAG